LHAIVSRFACDVVDELHVDVFVCEPDAHSGAGAGAADFLANAPAALALQGLFLFDSHDSSATEVAVAGLG
jgi:hypothetical protein